MSQPTNPGDPLFQQPTDPLSGQIKWKTPGTDPISGMAKIETPGTDPVSGMAKIETPGTDPVTGMAKIEMPGTDPVSGMAKIEMPGTDPLSGLPAIQTPGVKPPNPNFPPGVKPPNPNLPPGVQRGGRGVRNTIIIVCLIAILLIGGGYVIESAQPGAAGSNTIGGQPGVVLRERQIQVYTSAKEQMTTSGNALCAADGSQGAFDERLVGGGFTADDDHGNMLVTQSSYPFSNDDWHGAFLPQEQGHTATVIAACLREPASFFTGLQSFDVAQSLPRHAAHDDKYPASAVAVAACPAGEAILGGGYQSEYSGGGVYSIDASYPVYANGVGEWTVAFHVDPANGLQRVQLTAYAVCAKGLTSHLEHKAIAGIATRKNPYTQDSMACAGGTLLTGGYQITAAPSLVVAGDDSPLNDITRTPANGALAQQWYVELSSSGWQAHVSPGELWVTCLDAPNNATPGATATTLATTLATTPATTPATRPTSTPRPRATATTRPKPTNTPAPSCHSIVTGSGSMNVDNIYLNVDSSTGIGHTLSGAQARWDTVGALLPVNGAALDDLGAVGSGKYSGLTCANLESASYIARKVPVANGEVFLVKTPSGHFAKVLITLAPGNASPTLTWQTYQP